FRLAHAPAHARVALERVVVCGADGDVMGHVLRGEHRAEGGGRGPVEGLGPTTPLFGHGLSAKPEEVREQEEEEKEAVLLRDAIEAYRGRVESPQSGCD